MPVIFPNYTPAGATYDLTITTALNWTESTGGMPNGDDYIGTPGTGIDATFNINGDDFDFTTGTGWSIEFWSLSDNATSVYQVVLALGHVVAGPADDVVWDIFLDINEKWVFNWFNTGAGLYTTITTPSAISLDTWHHIVVTWVNSTHRLAIWLDNSEVANTTSVTGTPKTPTGSDQLYLGTLPTGALDLGLGASGMLLAKVAIYDHALSSGEIDDHYLAMTT